LIALTATTASATYDSLSACQTFAAGFNDAETCGGQTDDLKFSDYAGTDGVDAAWTQSSSITCSIQTDLDSWDPEFFYNVNGDGNEATNSSVIRKLCVTCS
jgi:hypothetical protein